MTKSRSCKYGTTSWKKPAAASGGNKFSVPIMMSPTAATRKVTGTRSEVTGLVSVTEAGAGDEPWLVVVTTGLSAPCVEGCARQPEEKQANQRKLSPKKQAQKKGLRLAINTPKN
jgi:hypothetical protein